MITPNRYSAWGIILQLNFNCSGLEILTLEKSWQFIMEIVAQDIYTFRESDIFTLTTNTISNINYENTWDVLYN